MYDDKQGQCKPLGNPRKEVPAVPPKTWGGLFRGQEKCAPHPTGEAAAHRTLPCSHAARAVGVGD